MSLKAPIRNQIYNSDKETNTFGQYAPLDTAFTQSETMQKFKNKVLSHNPLKSLEIGDDNNAKKINNKLNDILKKHPTKSINKDKMDNNIDEVISSIYNDNITNKQYQQTNPYYPMPMQYGGPIVEGYNNNTKTGKGWLITIIVIIIISALIYFGYKWYFQKNLIPNIDSMVVS